MKSWGKLGLVRWKRSLLAVEEVAIIRSAGVHQELVCDRALLEYSTRSRTGGYYTHATKLFL